MKYNRFDYFEQMKNALKKYEHKYSDNIRFCSLKMIIRNLKWLIILYKPIKYKFKDDKIHILFELSGGFGDILINLNYLHNFYQKFSNSVVIDIVVPNNLFSDIKSVINDQIYINQCLSNSNEYSGYDLSINLVRIPIIKKFFNKEKILKVSALLYTWIVQNMEFCYKNNEYIYPGTVSDGILSNYSILSGQNRLTQADVIKFINVKDVLKIKLFDSDSILTKFNLRQDEYIVIQNGAGLNSVIKTNNIFTRDWLNNNFNNLVKHIKKKYPNYKIVQIGYSTQQFIENVDLNLLGKTNFIDLLSIVGNAKLLIASESGVIHFRHFTTKKPSVVLFGPTKPEMYAYSENINIVSPICYGCEWIHDNWRNYCLKTCSSNALCMIGITPEYVLDKIKERNVL